jgi:hypothetical protein
MKRSIQRSNGWTEFERKNPVTNKRFDILWYKEIVWCIFLGRLSF